tara:strand:- start:30 stop:1271 length:1242 start_codon:yes stop_codon:yes gene_type:complete
MANTIQIKRSPALLAPLPGSLTPGELAFVDHGAGGANGVLYIGDAATGAVQTIGGSAGSAYVLDLLDNTGLTGIPTAPTQPLPGSAGGAPSTQVATSEYVNNRIAMSGGSFASLTDTDFTGQALANGHLAVYDADTNGGEWQNQVLSGDIVMDKNGNVEVTGVSAGAIDLDNDANADYVKTVSGTANEITVSQAPGSAGARGVDANVGLATNVTVAGTLTVTDELVVMGGTTTVQSTVVTVADPVFVLGEHSNDNFDRGVEFKYNDGTTSADDKQGFFGHDDSAGAFTYFPNSTKDANGITVASGSVGNAIFADITGANITGTLVTAIQPNVTTMAALVEVGTITTGTWGPNATTIAVPSGGTGVDTVASQGILVGQGTSAMTTLALGNPGEVMQVNAGGTAVEYGVLDGGTF